MIRDQKWIAVAVIVIAAAAGLTFALLTRDPQAPRVDPAPTGDMVAKAPTFGPTVANAVAPSGPAPEGMVWIPGGEFSMGATDPLGVDANVVGMQATTDSRPIHRVYVDGFWMDKTEVTNEKFAAFVKATNYVTVAERKPRAEDFPGAPPENLIAGSVVFSPPDHAVPLNDHFQWWAYIDGANWRHPEGPQSDLKGREQYPVLHVAYEDAEAYREVGRKADSHRGGMGIRRTRRPRWPGLSLGQRVHARRKVDGEHPSGPFPARGHAGGFVSRCRAGRAVPTEWLRPSMMWPAMSGSGRATGIALTIIRELEKAGGVARNPQGPARFVRPERAGRAEARPSRRLIPVHRTVLLALHGRHARQGRAVHRDQSSRFPAGQGNQLT